jgi:pimeloyl-ACP methyl ester carboxylesterase
MATTPQLSLRPAPAAQASLPDGDAAAAASSLGAPAVVLIHGMASSSERDFEQSGWVRALHEAGRDVVLVDLPGHGTAAGDGGAVGGAAAGEGGAEVPVLDVPELLGHIAAGVAELVAGPVDVLGFSLGSRLAWDLPAVGLDVRRLALVGLAPQEPFGALDSQAFAAVVLEGAAPADPMTGMIAGMVSQPEAGRAERVGLVAALGATPFDPQAAPAVPTLVAAGAEDPVAGSPEWAAAVLSAGQTLVVPGDHVGSLLSEEFRAAALAFLA